MIDRKKGNSWSVCVLNEGYELYKVNLTDGKSSEQEWNGSQNNELL